MDARIIKAWKCPGGQHVLGQVVREGKVTQLLLYREAVDLEAGGDPPEVMAVVEGYAAEIRCSRCGRVRTWVPGEEALRRLLARMGNPNKKEENLVSELQCESGPIPS